MQRLGYVCMCVYVHVWYVTICVCFIPRRGLPAIISARVRDGCAWQGYNHGSTRTNIIGTYIHTCIHTYIHKYAPVIGTEHCWHTYTFYLHWRLLLQSAAAQVSPYFSLLGDLDEIEQENEWCLPWARAWAWAGAWAVTVSGSRGNWAAFWWNLGILSIPRIKDKERMRHHGFKAAFNGTELDPAGIMYSHVRICVYK
jgi:hypothetical protein